MKPRWRPGQKKTDNTCPQWILDGVNRIHQQAINRTEHITITPAMPELNAQSGENNKEYHR